MKKLHVGTAFQSALDFFKENYEYILPFSLLYLLLTLPAQFIPSSLVLLIYILIIPLQFSIQYYTDRKLSTGEANFGTFFEFYKHCGRYLVAIIIKGFLFALLLLPLLFSVAKNIDISKMDYQNPNEMMMHIDSIMYMSDSILPVVLTATLLFIFIPLMLFFEYYMTFQHINIGDAFRKSFKSGMDNFCKFSSQYSSLYRYFFLGMLACGVGLIFSYPIGCLLLYFSFRELEIEEA